MSSSGSISAWLQDLKEQGDADAIRHLWEAYFQKLVVLARGRLRVLPRRAAADEEDVALSAFASFVRAVGEGRLPKLEDRNDLWQVLIVLTVRKAADLIKYESRERRDLWITRCLGDLEASGRSDDSSVFAELVAVGEPPPELIVEMAEEGERLLTQLGNDELRRVAVLKMEGFTNPEIAAQLGCALATVERRLQLIRKQWEAKAALPADTSEKIPRS